MNTTKENNRLIAEFMGLNVEFDNREGAYYNTDNGELIGIELKYHSSWDWLMPVYIEIRQSVDIMKNQEVLIQQLELDIISGDRDRVYTTIVDILNQSDYSKKVTQLLDEYQLLIESEAITKSSHYVSLCSDIKHFRSDFFQAQKAGDCNLYRQLHHDLHVQVHKTKSLQRVIDSVWKRRMSH
jgi:hypothetical protein